jgi:AraC family transcriptional regulator
MEPKIVEREAFTVVGMRYRGKNENNEIPQMWGVFGPRMQEIEDVANRSVCYGISDNVDASTGEFDYIAGLEVSGGKEVPEGMVSWEVPAGRYAVFPTTLPKIGETFQHAYHEWMPASEFEHRPGPDFEQYDQSFDNDDPDSQFDLFIPLK